MNDRDLLQISIQIIDSAKEKNAFPALLQTLVSALQADDAWLLFRGGAWRLGHEKIVANPVTDSLRNLRFERVYTREDWPNCEITIPERGDCRALGINLPSGPAWFVLVRKRGQMRAVDSARLSALAPHLAQALKLAERLYADEARQSGMSLALRRASIGVLHLDKPPPAFPHADTTAQVLMAAHGLTLGALVQYWPRDLGGDCLIEIGNQLDLVVTPHPCGQGTLGFLRPRLGSLPEPAMLAQSLGLSLSEARFARALALGTSLDHAARELGLTEATARFYSKQIFAKTHEPGQAALMRRIWASALILLRGADSGP